MFMKKINFKKLAVMTVGMLVMGIAALGGVTTYGAEAETATASDAELAATAGYSLSKSNGYYYLYDSGELVTEAGWYSNSGETIEYRVGSDGYVDMKDIFVEGDDSYYSLFQFDETTGAFNQVKGAWVYYDDVTVVYCNASGSMKRLYCADIGVCFEVVDGELVQDINTYITLYDGKLYYFNGSGYIETSEGWYKRTDSQWVRVCSNGYVTFRMNKTNGYWKLYGYSYSNKAWSTYKSVWVTAFNNRYYFNANGIATRIYYGSLKKCYDYQNGKMVLQKNTIVSLNNGIYYFNSNGVCDTTAGWKKINSTKCVLVGSSGYVTSTMIKSGGFWRFYSYNYTNKTWTLRKNVWTTAYGNQFYFNSSGLSTRIYYGSQKKCYEYSNGKMVLQKNTIKTIGSYVYYFNAKGIRVTTAGTYKTGSGMTVYVNSSGVVSTTDGGTTDRWYTIKLANGKTTKVYGHYDNAMADEIVRLLNQYRTSKGLSTLKTTTALTTASQIRAYEISYLFDHTRPNGETCFTASSEMYAENIAAGFTSASAVMNGWKNSEGHNANMLGNYATVGISVFVTSDSYGTYFVQNFGY